MAVTENDTNDSSVDESSDEDEYEWDITEEGSRFHLRKKSFSTYEWDLGHTVIEFHELRDKDEGIQLRDRDRNTLAVVDPENTYIPDHIETAFTLLLSEV